jgi:hypothetical protein
VSVSLLILVLGFAALEVGFRLVAFDFSGKYRAHYRLPVFNRQATHPSGELYLRRPGHTTWTGKPLTTILQLRTGDDAVYPGETEVTITYDRLGFRNPDSLTDWEVVVVGDSFVELGHLPKEELFTTHLAKELGRSVKNLGVSGTGPLTQIHYLEAYGKAPSTKVALLVFYEGNDIRNLATEARALKEFERTGVAESRSITRQSSMLAALVALLESEDTAQPPSRREGSPVANATFRCDGVETPVTVTCHPADGALLPRREQRLLQEHLPRWGEVARKLGLEPWLVYMPCKHRVLYGHLQFSPEETRQKLVTWGPSDLPTYIEGICRNAGIQVHDLTPVLKAEADAGRLPYNTILDMHLNRSGSRLVARDLAEVLAPIFDTGS